MLKLGSVEVSPPGPWLGEGTAPVVLSLPDEETRLRIVGCNIGGTHFPVLDREPLNDLINRACRFAGTHHPVVLCFEGA